MSNINTNYTRASREGEFTAGQITTEIVLPFQDKIDALKEARDWSAALMCDHIRLPRLTADLVLAMAEEMKRVK